MPECPCIEARTRHRPAVGPDRLNATDDGACGVAVGLDGRGRHYFVTVDGLHFRNVPHFPLGADQARAMFGEARAEGPSKLQLLAAYGGEIAFVPMS